MPAAGRPARRKAARSASARASICETMAGPDSPPVPSPPWQRAHRVSYCCRPAGAWAWAAEVTRSTPAATRNVLMSREDSRFRTRCRQQYVLRRLLAPGVRTDSYGVTIIGEGLLVASSVALSAGLARLAIAQFFRALGIDPRRS